ncbi:MAG: methyltransferase domain-containing protein [Chthonomonadales bacterium]|nr:methyltransferase domain-containing protein [Chthonomonadales bacterium]
MPDPSPIFDLATGYWRSAAFLAAANTGVFEALADGADTPSGVAARLGTDPRATHMLLDACTAMGLLVRHDEAFALTDTAQMFLVPGSPAYLGSALKWSSDQYEPWGRLADAVRRGRPVVDMAAHLGDDPDQTRAFVLGMHERALGVARGVVGYLNIGDARDLLDVGGGPGTYSMLLAQRYASLRATVLDLPGVIRWTRKLVGDAGLDDRVSVVAGDAMVGDYGVSTYDAVLFSGVLHQMSEASIRRMFAGAIRALRPGGVVLISDIMMAPDGSGPLFATLFALQMLLTTAEGGVFRSNACERWLVEAGFVSVTSRVLPPPMPYTVVQGERA